MKFAHLAPPIYLSIVCAGCIRVDTSLPLLDIDFEVSLSEAIPTVASARWIPQADESIETWIEYGLTRDYGLVAPVELAEGQELPTQLLGMKQDSEYHFRLAKLHEDGQVQYSQDQTVCTGSPTFTLPAFEVTEFENSPTDPGFIITSTLVEPATVLIVDLDGDIVWWHMAEEETIGRVQLSKDGTGVYYHSVNYEGKLDHLLYYISFDGLTRQQWSVPEGHHDFAELPDGTIAMVAYDRRMIEGQEILGDKILELSLDGSIVEVYSTWEVMVYEDTADATQGTEWTHANVLKYDESDDSYVVSFRSLDSIQKIDRATGETVWILGGSESDFTLGDGSTALFDSQHQFELLDESILVFVNGDEGEAQNSMAVEYAFDQSSPEVEEIWSYENDPNLFCFSLGDVQRLENGNTHVNWSVQGQIDEISPEGEVLWRLNGSLGSAFGYSERVDHLYQE